MDKGFYSVASSIARDIALVAAFGTLYANGGAAAGAADASAPIPEKLQLLTEFFDSEVVAGRLPGAVILIQQHGLPVYLKCLGVRDVATKLPMTPDTIFALHSMTKPITSLAAMMLIDAGKLSLADPVAKYIPSFGNMTVGLERMDALGEPMLEFVPAERQLTIRDLLRHTSEISYEYIGGQWVRLAYSEAHLFEGHFDNKEFAERIAKLPLARQPGTLWRYGYSTDVLGRVIEIVSGQTLYQFEKQYIFDPLGMIHTKFVLDTPERRRANGGAVAERPNSCRQRETAPRPPRVGVRRRRTGFDHKRLCALRSDDSQWWRA